MDGPDPAFLCLLSELVDGRAHIVADPLNPGPATLLLLRSADKVFGFVNRCPHFGVPLAQRQEQLLFKPHASVSCNVHYSRFRWQDGVCEFGECEGESLTSVSIKVDDDRVYWMPA